MTKRDTTSTGGKPLREQLAQKSRRRRDTAKTLATRTVATPARNDVLPTLTVVQRPIDQLRYPKRNVRRSTDAHIREVANAIAALGFTVPVLIDREGVIVDGVTRVEAARQLGIGQIPCISVEHLDQAEIRTLRLATNRLAEKGEWDLDTLKLEFEELIELDMPFDITGFELDEIDHICLDDAIDASEKGELAPGRDAVAVSRVGDCFSLGRHRLVCGDATDPSVYERLLDGDDAARLVLTDEPYNVRIAGNVSRGDHREFVMASGEMSASEFQAFNETWMTHAAAALCDGGVLATFCDWRALQTVTGAAAALGLDALNLVVWAKTNGGMGSLYRSQHELLPLFKKGDAPHVNNVELGAKGRWRSNVWTYPGASSRGSDSRRGLKEHPTVKPQAMIEDALLDLTQRDDLVLDPFLGSGTTLLAADKVGRVCRGIELDPLYVDVIIRRYQTMTGEVATLAGSGISFDELAEQRARQADAMPEDATVSAEKGGQPIDDPIRKPDRNESSAVPNHDD